MYATERQDLIERLLSDEERLAVVELARRFGVTTETVRRDLAALEARGVLRRVHGGAIPSDRSSTRETSVSERVREHGDEKRAIAERALDLLDDGFDGSLFIDAGTTTAAIADRLPARLARHGGHAEVVTHSFALAPSLADADAVSLSVIGGRVRGVTSAAVGAGTVGAIGRLRPDIAFVGTNGISAGLGLSTPDPDEAAVKQAIVRAARLVVVVCDASKFGRELLVGFAELTDIDVLVTDAAPTGDLADALAAADVEVRVA